MARLRRFGSLPPFPRSLVTNSPRTNEGDPDATAARAKNDLIRENLPQGIISNSLRECGYPAWIRTKNNASKGRCVTVTPRGIRIRDFRFAIFDSSAMPKIKA